MFYHHQGKTRWLACALACMIALTLCAPALASEPYWDDGTFDPLGKYDETVSVTQTRILTTWMGFDEGEDEDNNWWTRTYKEQLNIELTNLFTAPNWGPDFDMKINVAFATDSLPDVIPLYTTLAARAIQGGKVMDLTDVYEYCASQAVKDIMATDPLALEVWKVDGKLYGLSNPKSLESWTYLWVPQSWIDELNGGVVPSTFAEIEEFAVKVKEKTGSAAFGAEGTTMEFVDMLVQAYHGTYEWGEADGQLEWGKIQDPIKQAWTKAAEWYKQGLIARDFASKNTDDMQADYLNGKVGIQNSSGNFPNGDTGRNWIKLNEDDSLVAIPLMAADGAPLYITKSAGYGNALMISAKCENPDAVMRLYNLSTAISNDYGKPDFITNADYNNTPGGNMGFWNRLCTGGGYATDTIEEHQASYIVGKLIAEGKDDSELLAAHAFDSVDTYQRVNSWITEGTAAENWDLNWSLWSMILGAGTHDHSRDMRQNGFIQASPNWGMETEAQAENNQNLYAKYFEFATLGIMNDDVDHQFDAWVDYFWANGGTAIYEQVNAWYDSTK
ncbi:hypothetical protein AGMMS49992_03710 [Clostridia bacterium]|nr:hypothetical protein AGMMS49992_03710 [Clostridia bacterium]